ncbi:MAG: hypothetical protein P4K98_08530 [Bryobacteraceae bacterium]|nr:hypothetical protein [Bryobacteraceae bacterium]
MGLKQIVAYCIVTVAASACLSAAGETFRIPPLSTTVNLDEQPLRLTVSGTIATAPGPQKAESVQVNLQADLSDLQAHITELLRAHLNQSNRCGLRLNLEHAELAPRAPDALLTARVHVEKYVCAKALGRQMITKLIAGEGTVTVRLTPTIENSETLRLAGEVVSVQADGALGDLLQSEPTGSWLREKMRDSLADTLQKSLSKLKADLPPAIHGLAAIQTARFADAGAGRLGLDLAGAVQISPDMAQIMIEKLKEQVR